MPLVAFRCDSSRYIGSGHVMRCRTLARYLTTLGYEIVFLCRPDPGNLIAQLECEFNVITLSKGADPFADSSTLQADSNEEDHNARFQLSEEDDALVFIDHLVAFQIPRPDWIVVDQYLLSAVWEELVYKNLNNIYGEPIKILALDDLANRHHCSDLLVDQNYYGDFARLRYKNLIDPTTTLLTGPKYALLGSEYAQLGTSLKARRAVKRILIFFSAVDLLGLTLLTLESLRNANLDDKVVDVVLSPESPSYEDVKYLTKLNPKICLHPLQPTLSTLIAKADLSIGGGGSTTWERACLGLPSIVIISAENQRENMSYMDSAGLITLLDKNALIYSDSALAQAINHLSNEMILEPISQRLSNLVDGKGTSRIADLMRGAPPV